MKLIIEVTNPESTERCIGTCCFYRAFDPRDRWCSFFRTPLLIDERGNTMRCQKCREGEEEYLKAKRGE